MRLFWKIAIPGASVAVICGAAITWKVYTARADNRKLTEDATVLRISAEHGDAKAEFRLGSMFYHGQGVQQDYREAMRWYRKAADQGDTKAQYDIGYMYDLGQGVPQDYSEALRWYHKAADQGDANAQCSLGSMYYDGRGIQQDRAVAVNWYRQAANSGLARAQYGLGYMYYHGQGVPEDRAEADLLYHKAADQGDERAQRALGLRGTGLSVRSGIGLSVVFLGCMWLLKDSLLPGKDLRSRQQRALLLGELSGLAYVGLNLYGALGIFQSVLTVNAFYFVKNFAIGMAIATAISVFSPKIARVALGISSILFLGINLLAIVHHDLRRFAETVRLFCSVDGFLLGMSIPLTVLLWLTYKKSRDGSRVSSMM